MKYLAPDMHWKAKHDVLAAELAAAKRQDELHWRTRKSYLDHIAKLEAALREIADTCLLHYEHEDSRWEKLETVARKALG